jgi:hypothetical protein
MVPFLDAFEILTTVGIQMLDVSGIQMVDIVWFLNVSSFRMVLDAT